MHKPKVIVKQTLREVICVYAAWCNQNQVLETLQKFTEDWWLIFHQLPRTLTILEAKGETSQAFEGYKESFYGPAGFSFDVLKQKLNAENVSWWNCSVEKAAYIEQGYIGVFLNDQFFHCIAIRDGYAIDSIGARCYAWKGKVQHYRKFTIEMAITLTPPTDLVNNSIQSITIDLT